MDKTGGYAVFGAVPPILVVGINGVGTDSGDFCAKLSRYFCMKSNSVNGNVAVISDIFRNFT